MFSLIRKLTGKERPQSDGGQRSPLPYLLVFLVAQVLVYALTLSVVRPDSPGREVTLDEFNRMVNDGVVSAVTILDYDSRIAGTDPTGAFWTALPRGELAVNNLTTTLANSGIPTTVDQQVFKGLLNFLAQFLLPVLLFVTLFAILFVLFLGAAGVGGFAVFGRSRARRAGSSESTVTFADVAGLDETIRELAEVKDFLVNPERFESMGARVPKGVLLVGPPGCGKTLLARAVAGEANVPFFSASGSEFVEMLVGVGAARVRDLFRQAREAAPSIVFIDELDAVGRARSGSAVTGSEEHNQTLNEMLVQMDGFGPDTRVVVITATNRSDVLDEALTRPGRFDRRIVVDHPDVHSRQAILEVHARGKPLAADVDLSAVARRTPGFTGADLANVLNEAAILAGRRGATAIGRRDVEEGIDRAVAGAERRSRILSPSEKRRVAVHEAGHALVAWLLRGADAIERVSIVARGTSLGHTRTIPEEEQILLTRRELTDRISVSLAGRVAEMEVFGEPSNGAIADLQAATRLARHMVNELGMSDAVPPLAYRGPGDIPGAWPEHSERVAQALDDAVADLVRQAEAAARTALVDHPEWLERLARELESHETLHREDVEKILSGLARGGQERSPIRGEREPASPPPDAVTTGL